MLWRTSSWENAMKKSLKVPSIQIGGAYLYHTDALSLYEEWPQPTCIIADGPYGLGKFPGEPATHHQLGEWYAPHIAAWARYAATDCTLWFWNTELGWATVHPVLEQLGWEYEELCVWDKGIAHLAGNVNSKTIRGVPVVTEVAVRYTRKNKLSTPDGHSLSLKEWVRAEWLRSGLQMYKANIACGVANAATRKYLTECHLWYFPPADAIARMADYCEAHGAPNGGWPYFSLDGRSPFDPVKWLRMRARWVHTHGLTNVWQAPPVHGSERIKIGDDYLHANQKPLALMDLQVRACTAIGDAVWEPFGGLCSASLAASRLNRRAFAAEINADYFSAAGDRLRSAHTQYKLAV
jgi:site-specific DNA-methyltransferase (adenine-specific)